MDKNMISEIHYITRSGWLRAAILGANDGILSTASLIIGVAAASSTREPIILAGVAGLVAGALSMAAGEYVSVSSQSDLEQADIKREIKELEETPEIELEELTKIYQGRGLDKDLAHQVAVQLTSHNALETHMRDELGITELSQAQPLQAALASGLAFVLGGGPPLLVAFIVPLPSIVWVQYFFTTLFLVVLGGVAAKAGGSSIWKAILRVTFWGTMAMGITAFIGNLVGAAI